MNTDDLKEISKALTAYAEGKPIQWNTWSSRTWEDWSASTAVGLFHNLAHDSCFRLRVKPTPEVRVLRMDELPPLFWVRTLTLGANDTAAWGLVCGVSPSGFLVKWPGGKEECYLLDEATANKLIFSCDRKQNRSFLVTD